MPKPPEGIYYGDYLKLEQILGAQQPISDLEGSPAHDEMLFIVVHQAYELWFKQILFELESVLQIMQDPVLDDHKIGVVIARFERIHAIQQLLIQQIDVLETMTPLDFLEFRDYLVPASGFQSVQFKELEIRLGVKTHQRIPADRQFLQTRLAPADQKYLANVEAEASLFELTDNWLGRMPFLKFGSFEFWKFYRDAVDRMLELDAKIIEKNLELEAAVRQSQEMELEKTKQTFASVLDEDRFRELQSNGQFRLSHSAFLAALFINLYRTEPILYLPFRLLTLLVDIDESLTRWRSRHVLMVQRMIGTKIGTGGSTGHEFLQRTAQQNRVFLDLYKLATFLIPRSELPELPANVRRELGFHFSPTTHSPAG